MLGSQGERSGGNQQAAPSAAPQTSEPLPTLRSQLIPPVTCSYSVDPLLWASAMECCSSSPGSRDFDASDVSARSHRHGQISTERRDRLRSMSSYWRPDRSSSPLHQDRSMCSRERQPGYRHYRSHSHCCRRYRSWTRSYSHDHCYRTQRRDCCTGYASSHGSWLPRRWSRGWWPCYSCSATAPIPVITIARTRAAAPIAATAAARAPVLGPAVLIATHCIDPARFGIH